MAATFAKSGMRSHPVTLVALLSLNAMVLFLDRSAFMLLAPLIQPDLRLSNLQIGTVSAALAIAWACAGLIVGWLVDLTGKPRLILVAGTVLFSFSSILSGFAAGFLSLLLTRGLMGLAEGGLLPASQSLLLSEVAPERRGLTLGIFSSAGINLAAFLGPPLIIAIATGLSWQHAFWALGAPGLLTATLILLFVSEQRVSADRETRDIAVSVFLNRNILINLLLAVMVTAAGAAGASFLPLYLVKVVKLSPAQMSLIIMTYAPAMFLYGILCPSLSDWLGRKTMLVIFSAISLSGGVVLLYNGGDVRLIIVGTILGSAIAGAIGLVLGVIPAEAVAPGQAATAIGLTMFVAELVGGGLGPIAVGHMADLYGLTIVPSLLTVLPLLLGLAALLLRETAPRQSLLSVS